MYFKMHYNKQRIFQEWPDALQKLIAVAMEYVQIFG
jgi:hypothetical protein